MTIPWAVSCSWGSSAHKPLLLPSEPSSSSLPSGASLIHVCRFNAGKEGQLYPYIITVLWLSLIPEVLMQIKWETPEKEPLQLLHSPALPAQSLILIVRSKGNFVCSLNALQFSQWPLHILSQIPILINCLQIIKLLRDNGTRLMYTTKVRAPVPVYRNGQICFDIPTWLGGLLYLASAIRLSFTRTYWSLLNQRPCHSGAMIAEVFRGMARGDLAP